MDATFTVRADKELLAHFTAAANETHQTASQVLRDFMRTFIEETSLRATPGAVSMDQGIEYETARECVTDLMGIYTALMHKEEREQTPDVEKIKKFTDMRSQLFAERAGLRATDAENVKRIIRDYGSLVKAWANGEKAELI